MPFNNIQKGLTALTPVAPAGAFSERADMCAKTVWGGMKTVWQTAKPYLSSVSEGLYNHIHKNQLAGAEHLAEKAPKFLKLLQRTVTVPGGDQISLATAGVGGLLGFAAATPVLGAMYKAAKRTRNAYSQSKENKAILERAASLPENEKFALLVNRGTELMNKGLKQRSVAQQSIGAWGFIKYGLTIQTAWACTPQILKLVTLFAPVSTPAALPLTLSVGGILCGVRFVSARIDAWREKAQATETLKQADMFRSAANDILKARSTVKGNVFKGEFVQKMKLEKADKQARITKLEQENKIRAEINQKQRNHIEVKKKQLKKEKESHAETKETHAYVFRLYTEILTPKQEEVTRLRETRGALVQELAKLKWQHDAILRRPESPLREPPNFMDDTYITTVTVNEAMMNALQEEAKANQYVPPEEARTEQDVPKEKIDETILPPVPEIKAVDTADRSNNGDEEKEEEDEEEYAPRKRPMMLMMPLHGLARIGGWMFSSDSPDDISDLRI